MNTLEAHRAALASYLGGIQLKTPLHYFKYPDLKSLAKLGHCNRGNAACFDQGRGIEASVPFEQHELVHAYLSSFGDTHRLLEEGAAEALSCGGKLRVPLEISWQNAFSNQSWDAAARSGDLRRLYDAAGSFVGYLLHQYGRQRFLKLYTQVRTDFSAAQIAEVFGKLYPDPLPVVWQTALAQDPESACVFAYECSSPTLTEAPLSSWSKRCDRSDLYRTLELDGNTWLEEHPRGYGARIVGCDPATHLPFAKRLPRAGAETDRAALLAVPAAGRYLVALAKGETRLLLNNFERSRYLARDCENARVWDTAGARDVTLAVNGRLVGVQQQWHMLWRRQSPSGERFGLQCSEGLQLEVCVSCDPASCHVLCDEQKQGSHTVALPNPSHWRLHSLHSLHSRQPADAWFELHRISP